MQNPVIVMGMHKSGTSLLAQMLHEGGTPMITSGVDPSYDLGSKHERRTAAKINLRILNAREGTRYLPALMPIWKWPLSEFPTDLLEELEAEVGDSPWGFKDPRTTITYPVWAKQFPKGARFSIYRSHREFLRRCFKRSGPRAKRLWRARREINAWYAYNHCLLRNYALDEAEKRPHVVLQYEEVMEHPSLIELAAQITNIPLFDSRNMDMRRTKGTIPEKNNLETMYIWAGELGNMKRINALYADLANVRLTPKKP
jgi:hypothetical protein